MFQKVQKVQKFQKVWAFRPLQAYGATNKQRALVSCREDREGSSSPCLLIYSALDEECESKTTVSQFSFVFSNDGNSCNSQQLIFSRRLTPDSASAAKMLSCDICCRRVSPKVALIHRNDPYACPKWPEMEPTILCQRATACLTNFLSRIWKTFC